MTCIQLTRMAEYPDYQANTRFAQIAGIRYTVFVSTNKELCFASFTDSTDFTVDKIIDTFLEPWANPYLILVQDVFYILYETKNRVTADREVRLASFTLGGLPTISTLATTRTILNVPRVWFIKDNLLTIYLGMFSDWSTVGGPVAIHDVSTILKFTVGPPLLCTRLWDLPTSSVIRSIILSKDVTGDLKHCIFTAKGPGYESCLYRFLLDTELPILLLESNESNNYGMISDISAISSGTNTCVFYAASHKIISYDTTGKRIGTFIRPKLYYIYDSSIPTDIVPEGIMAVSHLNLDYSEQGDLFLSLLNDPMSAHARVVKIYKVEQPLTVHTPVFLETAYYAPFNSRVTGISVERDTFGLSGALITEDPGQSDAWLNYFDTTLDPLVAEIVPPILQQVPRGEIRTVRVDVQNAEGAFLEYYWSTTAASVSFSTPTLSQTDVIFGPQTPEYLFIDVIVKRGSQTVTRSIQVTMVPHQVPRITIISPITIAWHELKSLYVTVDHDPAYPITLELSTGTEVSLASNGAPSWGMTQLNMHSTVEEAISRFDFNVLPWHIFLAGQVEFINVTARDSLSSSVASIKLVIGAFPSSNLGPASISRYAYNGGIKLGDFGMGFNLTQKTALLSSFHKVKRLFSLNLDHSYTTYWVFFGAKSILIVDDWATESHQYIVAYDDIIDSELSSEGICAILTTSYVDMFDLKSPQGLVTPGLPIPTPIPQNFRYRDIATQRILFDTLRSHPLKIKAAKAGVWFVQTAKEFIYIDSERTLPVTLVSLGCDQNDNILDLQFYDIGSVLAGFMLVTIQQADESFACILYNLATRNTARVWAGEVLPDPDFMTTLLTNYSILGRRPSAAI